VLFAAGLAFGATTTVATGEGQAVAWIALSGLGLGLVLPTTIDAALGAVSDESSGVSSAVLQALRMVGGTFGAAILSALINATYHDQLEQAASPAQAASLGDSAVAGVDAATATHSAPLLDAVRDAFVSGMGRALWVSAALMAAGAVLAVVFRPDPTQFAQRPNRKPHPMSSPPEQHSRSQRRTALGESPADVVNA
jgi:MFS transporter, DHA2 family, multidrug resistance protein